MKCTTMLSMHARRALVMLFAQCHSSEIIALVSGAYMMRVTWRSLYAELVPAYHAAAVFHPQHIFRFRHGSSLTA
jgi:hypothetical protein